MRTNLDFEALFNASPNPYVLVTPDLTIAGANDAYLELMQMERDDMVGHDVFDVFPGDPSDPDDPDVRRVRESFERVLEEGAPVTLPVVRYTIPIQTSEGKVYKERYWSSSHTPIFDEHDELWMILHDVVEVTELQQLKNKLREAEVDLEVRENSDGNLSVPQIEGSVIRRAVAMQKANRLLDAERKHLYRLFDQAPGLICFLRGPRHVIELANKAYLQLVGHRDIIGLPIRDALPEIEGQGYLELLDQVYRTGEPFIGREMELQVQREKEGKLETAYLDFVYQPIVESDGSVSGIFVQGQEVTEQKRAQDELNRYKGHLEELVRERTRELEESETRLRQAQKMEAVGKLTGGVAHDFNNLLQIVSGNLQLLQRAAPESEKAQRRLETALQAVERGAKLSSQLLAFARRQPLEPKVINPGRLVRSMQEMLHRALGEMVRIETHISRTVWNVFTDAHQLENVILNLAINARDAMEGEGTVSIDVENTTLDDAQHTALTPGEYVRMTISDTGRGMSEEVIERAFEPYFTTKDKDKGTGLGLSMAYGFIKQSSGHISIRSAEEEGTSVEILLPRTHRAAEEELEILPSSVERGSETILVVEDDRDVLHTVVELLTDLGYHVLQATGGESALAILRSGVHVDLLFTDVVMPGPIKSTDVADEAQQLLPNLAVLFTSGYFEDTIVHEGRLDPGVHLLRKPYSQEDLARKIQYLLRNREQRIVASNTVEGDALSEMPEPESTLRILLVEDDETIQLLVSELIDELGHRAVVASSAEEALEAFDAHPCHVLFTDVTLPGMSGLELARKLQSRKPDLHVIIASGHSADDVVEHGEERMDAIALQKPYTVSQIEDVLTGLQS